MAQSGQGKKFLDLSAGCGLVGIVTAKFGGRVTATDLGSNLQLLKKNWGANHSDECVVRAHIWENSVDSLGGPFDIVAACDVMYIPQSVGSLVATLKGVSAQVACVHISHGRNCCAVSDFLTRCRVSFTVTDVDKAELHDVYQSEDVVVFSLM